MTKSAGHEFAVRVSDVGKRFQLYDRPGDRLGDLFRRESNRRGKAFWAVRHVSFEARRCETVGIVGSNGSGKSTLLQMLAGTLHATEGEIEVNGKVAALLELGAGFNPELTGRDNTRLCAAIHGIHGRDLDAVCEKIHAFADIGEFVDQPVKNYSSGMFVRLAFAVIAHVDASVMIVDEALSVGDAYFAQKCARFFTEFKARGAIVLVSHDLATVKSLCDRVIWLDKGVVMADGDPKSVVDQYTKFLYAKDQDVASTGHQVIASDSAASQLNEAGAAKATPDFRLAQVTPPGVWNALRAFRFKDDAAFGAGKVKIVDAYFSAGTSGERIEAFHGGERVKLCIEGRANVAISDPIFGFFVRNRAGVNLFGDNTFLNLMGRAQSVDAGQTLVGRFEFVMPSLPKGEYSVCVAVATGTNESHEQQQWINDAIMVVSLANDVHADVLGIPMLSMDLQVGSSTP